MFEHGKAAEALPQFRVQPDRRADEGERRVSVGRRDILITRRLAGVSMMITVPVRAYRGVALEVEPRGDGGASYRLSLAHRDPDLDVVLAETADGGAVSADWKYWAAYLDLPRLAREEGELETLDPRIGEVAYRGALERRRNIVVQQRRPRFSARRKIGEPARAGVVHEDEREIICYE
ncbi:MULTISPECIES: DUF6101 family protein [Methylosinus]|uniref:Uncharacterized protein n=1 Tax=Methylosinus trichosporium (strain ATCC 35070 / NCIMB 11131 / UNIQEM 75 / OB3b) TaxID=595536 RepID=A0A2D2D3B0_METT3|nr:MULTISPECIES: DUF6101 family protein [Methylosinus]ATQ69490.1 hypothetical protein CQW49_17590 [Methylosinus trichosporium OB3b]OBS51940.1 hypothetical protein A8B73_13590 [Methylosinus sp. 3S-1]